MTTAIGPTSPAHAAEPADVRVDVTRAFVGEDDDGLCGDPEFKAQVIADDPSTGRHFGGILVTPEHRVSFPELYHLPFEIRPGWSLRIPVEHPAPDVVLLTLLFWESDAGSICGGPDWLDVNPSGRDLAALVAVDLRTGVSTPWGAPPTTVWRGDGCADGEGCGLPIGQLDLDVSVWRNGARVEPAPTPTTQPPGPAPVEVPVPVNGPPRFVGLTCSVKGTVEARFIDDGPDAFLDVELTAVLDDGGRRTLPMGVVATGPTPDDVAFRATLAGLPVPLTEITDLELRAVDDFGAASSTVRVDYDVTDPKETCD
jgi:hypothetical protein